MLSRRTKLSMCQLLGLQERGFLTVLVEKHDLPPDRLDPSLSHEHGLRNCLEGASDTQLFSLLNEVIRTRDDLRARIEPRYRHDKRLEDLVRCLELDGYRVDNGQLIPIDPTIPEVASVDDDLSLELKRSDLPEATKILELTESSAQAFRMAPPDYNASLADARVALETLAKAIAKKRLSKSPGSFDETKWGEILAYLRTSGLVSDKQEQGIAGVYTFVSAAAHVPVGLTDEEMVRLGRSLVASLSYFLIKLHNA